MSNIDVRHMIEQLGGVSEVKRKLKAYCDQDVTKKGVQKWRERNTLGRNSIATLGNMQSIARVEGFELELSKP